MVEAVLDRWRELEDELWPSEHTESWSWSKDRLEETERMYKLLNLGLRLTD